MSSSPFSSGSSLPSDSIATPDRFAVDGPALRALDDRLAAVLQPQVVRQVHAAELVFRHHLGAGSAAPEVEDLINQTFGTVRAQLARFRDDLYAERRLPFAPMTEAIADAVASCGDDSLVPAEGKIAADRFAPPYGGEFTLYALAEAMTLRDTMSSRLEEVVPTVDRAINALTRPVEGALCKAGHFERLCGASSVEDVLEWLPREYVALRRTLEQFIESRIIGRKLILEKVHEPLDRLRADRVIRNLSRSLVRAISTGCVVKPCRPGPETGPPRVGRRWWRRPDARNWAESLVRAGRHLIATIPRMKSIVARPRPPEAAVRDHLKASQRKTVAAMDRALGKGLPHVQAQLAVGINELERQLLDANGRELKRLYRQHAAEIWGAELANLDRRSQLNADWQAAIARINDATAAATARCGTA